MQIPHEQTGVYRAQDGLKIFYRHYTAPEERAGIVLSHGLGEHSGRYGNLVAPLLKIGLSIWAPDHRGHGRSEGQRGHVASFNQYIEDLNGVMTLARADLSADRPCLLLGHSLGGLIALRLSQQFPALPTAVVVSSPALGLTVKVPALKSALGKIMSTIWPALALGNELDPAKISHDSEVVQAYIDDPLVHDRVSARWFTEFLGAIALTHQLAAQSTVPLLMQLAGDDHLTDVTASRAFFERVAIEDKTLYCYDTLYHEIYNEPLDQRTPVIDDLISWLKKRMGDVAS